MAYQTSYENAIALMRSTTADGLITATALEHGLAIETRNVKDFSESGATVINPWLAI
jgi:predicted nucleic acid-binding protein